MAKGGGTPRTEGGARPAHVWEWTHTHRLWVLKAPDQVEEQTIKGSLVITLNIVAQDVNELARK